MVVDSCNVEYPVELRAFREGVIRIKPNLVRHTYLTSFVSHNVLIHLQRISLLTMWTS